MTKLIKIDEEIWVNPERVNSVYKASDGGCYIDTGDGEDLHTKIGLDTVVFLINNAIEEKTNEGYSESTGVSGSYVCKAPKGTICDGKCKDCQYQVMLC